MKACREEEYQGLIYKLEALRSQIDRHFIFNALAAIQNYILKNDKIRAVEYLGDFSDLIRMVLEQSRKTHITLNEEYKFLLSYINLEILRFSNKFSCNISIDETLDPDTTLIPALLIQPYVENAIKHGLMHKTEYGKLEIHFMKNVGAIHISVKDDGIGRKKHAEIKKIDKKHEGLGQKITEERIEIYQKVFGDKFNILTTDLYDKENNAVGTQIDIYIPQKDGDTNRNCD